MKLVRLVGVLKNKDVLVSRFAIKSSLVGGIVYYTIEEGLWSKSEQSSQLYIKMYNNVTPYVQSNLPKEVVSELSHLPSVSCISSFMKTSWNRGVMTSMKFISEIPQHTCNGFDSLSGFVNNYLKQLEQ